MGKNRPANAASLSLFASMKKKIEIFLKENFWLILIILLGSFLRLYQIAGWQFFTYDQARDYLIVKRIIQDGKLTLIGPTVLVPGVYLPPFYYYSLIPFLYLFNFHLIGPDLYTAFLSIVAIAVFFILVKDFFGKETALFLTLIFSLNPYLIQTSRHAWNPNTIYLFTLGFAVAFERYVLKKNNNYLVLAAFCFSWALNLHYAVLAMFPLLLFLVWREIKTNGCKGKSAIFMFVFLIFVFPLFLFEMRHNFPNMRGILDVLGHETGILVRIPLVFRDMVKFTAMFLAGLNQQENLTVNSSRRVLFDKVSLTSNFEGIVVVKLIFGIVLALFLLFFMFGNKKSLKKLILAFFLSGFLIRVIFPPSSFYFYHYTFLFPFVILPLGFIFERINCKYGLLLAVFFAVFPLLGSSLKNEVKTESYFISVGKLIVENIPSETKATIAANLIDASRWDHNALEYRYFLEAFYRLPIGNWEAEDYKTANVLYLIDEGNLPEPLKLGGMEMEAFGPKKIEKTWQVATGQKIYKLTK